MSGYVAFGACSISISIAWPLAHKTVSLVAVLSTACCSFLHFTLRCSRDLFELPARHFHFKQWMLRPSLRDICLQVNLRCFVANEASLRNLQPPARLNAMHRLADAVTPHNLGRFMQPASTTHCHLRLAV